MERREEDTMELVRVRSHFREGSKVDVPGANALVIRDTSSGYASIARLFFIVEVFVWAG